MADPLNSPAESWRGRQREPLLDPAILRAGMVAAALAVTAGLGYAGFALLGQRPHVVPVVEADARPVRVRPDNPGGMQVVGADELVGAGSGLEAMAPPPEAPAPQALRAKIAAQTQPPPVAAPPVAPAPVPPAPAPVAAPVVARTSPPAKPAPAGPQIQLAALETQPAAMAEWQRLSQRMPELLAGRQPSVLRAERDGHAIYRLRTGGFADSAAAGAFCVQVRSKGAGCSIANF